MDLMLVRGQIRFMELRTKVELDHFICTLLFISFIYKFPGLKIETCVIFNGCLGSLLCSRKTSDIIEINRKKAHGPNLSKHFPQ